MIHAVLVFFIKSLLVRYSPCLPRQDKCHSSAILPPPVLNEVISRQDFCFGRPTLAIGPNEPDVMNAPLFH